MLTTMAIGHLGKDAVVKEVNGKKVISFSICHTEKYKDANGANVERSTWVECNYWAESTAIAPYLLKGGQVFVSGTPSVDAYMNNENKPVASLRLRVSKIELLGGKKEGTPAPAANGNSANNNQPAPAGNEPVDDLPF